MASKVRSHNNSTGTVDSGSSTLEPPAKKTHQDLDAKIISNPINSSSSSGVKAAKTLKQGGGVAGSAQTVFVVAPPTPPTYTCVCCFAKFTNETAVRIKIVVIYLLPILKFLLLDLFSSGNSPSCSSRA